MNLLRPSHAAISLRPFQADMVAQARDELRRHRAVLMQLPTGGGKTVLASFMIASALAKGGRPWFVCHRDFLLDQTSKTLERVGVEHGFIAAGRPFNPWVACQVVSINTLGQRLARIPTECRPTLMFFDEAKHSPAGTWRRVIEAFPAAKVVGLEATPERLDGKPLRDLYGAMVRGPTVEWLMSQGYLSQYRAFAPSAPDLHGVRSRAGDFATDELAAVMDTSTLIGDIVLHYKARALGRRAVYFCVSVHHSQHVAAAFNAAGVRAQHLDGTSPTAERVKAAQAVARGELDVLTNVDLFGEGYDLAAQAGRDVTIEAVGLCRPTQSLAMYMQQVGRALRPKPEPATILDHAGNILRHGMPDDDREWSLDGRPKGKKAGESTGPTPRICMSCFGAFASTRPACPHCGALVVREAKEPEIVEGELQEIDRAALRREHAMQEHAARSIGDLIRVGQARGYAHPERWAAHRWTSMERGKQDRAENQARQHRMGW